MSWHSRAETIKLKVLNTSPSKFTKKLSVGTYYAQP